MNNNEESAGRQRRALPRCTKTNKRQTKSKRCDSYTQYAYHHLVCNKARIQYTLHAVHTDNICWRLVKFAVGKDCAQSDEPYFVFSSSVSVKSSLLVFRMWFSVFICSTHFFRPFDAASTYVSVMRYHRIPETMRTF